MGMLECKHTLIIRMSKMWIEPTILVWLNTMDKPTTKKYILKKCQCLLEMKDYKVILLLF